MPELTHANFASLAGAMASSINRWSADALDAPDDFGKPIDDQALAYFTREMRGHLDRMWTFNVEWAPAPPTTEDEPGFSSANPRISEIWPGLYSGRCVHCHAHILAEKRTLSCDACEVSHREAITKRRAALYQSPMEGEVGNWHSLSKSAIGGAIRAFWQRAFSLFERHSAEQLEPFIRQIHLEAYQAGSDDHNQAGAGVVTDAGRAALDAKEGETDE